MGEGEGRKGARESQKRRERERAAEKERRIMKVRARIESLGRRRRRRGLLVLFFFLPANILHYRERGREREVTTAFFLSFLPAEGGKEEEERGSR